MGEVSSLSLSSPHSITIFLIITTPRSYRFCVCSGKQESRGREETRGGEEVSRVKQKRQTRQPTITRRRRREEAR